MSISPKKIQILVFEALSLTALVNKIIRLAEIFTVLKTTTSM